MKKKLFFISTFVILFFNFVLNAQETSENKRILFLSSFGTDRLPTQHVLRGFASGLAYSQEIYNLDLATLHPEQPLFQSTLKNLNAGKYDLLIILDNPALTKILKNYSSLPQNMPIISLPNELQKKFQLSSYKNITGIEHTRNIKKNIQLGLKLFPKTNKIILLTAATTMEARLRTEFGKIIGNLKDIEGEFISGAQTSTETMMNRMKKADRNTLVIFSSWSTSVHEWDFPHQWMVLTNLTTKTNIPILVMDSTLIGYGSVGGWVTNENQLGIRAAAMSRQILEKTSKNFPAWETMEPIPMFDAKALNKYGISISELPLGYVLNNAPLTLWKHYRQQFILAFTGFILTLTALSVFIFFFIRYKHLKNKDEIIFNVLPVTFGIIDKNHEIHLRHGFQHHMEIQYISGNKYQMDKMSSDHRERVQTFLNEVDSVLDTQLSKNTEYTLNNKRWRCKIYPLPNGIFPKPAVIWVTEDIDELYRNQKKAENKVMQLDCTLNAIGEGVITTDINEIITMINPTAEKLTGFTREESIGKPLSEIFRIVPEGKANPIEGSPVWQALLHKKIISSTDSMELISKNGIRHNIANTAAPIIPDSNIPSGAILVFRSISNENNKQACFDNILLKQAASIGKIEYFQYNAEEKKLTFLSNEKVWPADFNGTFESIKKWIAPQDAEKFWTQWQKIFTHEISELDVEYLVGTSPETSNLYRMKLFPDFNNKTMPKTYSGIIQDITHINRVELERLRMLENEGFLNSIIENIDEEDYPDERIQVLLNKILQNTKANRCYIFRMQENGTEADCIYEKSDENTQTYHDREPHINFSEIPNLLAAIQKTNTVITHERQEKNNPQLLHYLNMFGIKSQILCKVILENRIWGYIGIDYVHEEHSFSQPDLALITAASSLSTILLNRKKELESWGKITNDYINNNQDVFLLFDQKGFLKKVNPTTCALLEETEEKLLQTQYQFTFLRGTDNSKNPLQLCMETNTIQTGRMSLAGKQFRIRVYPLKNSAQKESEYFISGILENSSSDQKDIQYKIAESADVIEKKHIAFLNSMSHKLRSPLNSVIGLSELLTNSMTLTKEQKKYFNGIENAGHDLLHIIDNMQELSQLETGEIKLEIQKVSLPELIRDLVSTFQNQAEAKGLEFQVDIPKKLPFFELDAEKIKKILSVLLHNAIQNTGHGYIKLEVQYTTIPKTVHMAKLQFNVCDTGSGFPLDELNRLQGIFSNNEKDPLSIKQYTESGLGFPIIFRLSQLISGKLSVSSIEQFGSVFTLDLTAVTLTASESEFQSTAILNPDQEKGLILVVDDIELNLKLISAMLKRLNANFVTTTSPQAALEIAKNRDVSLILTDVWMPNITGEELADRIAADSITSEIPVIAVTADTQVKEGHFTEVLYKPIKIDRLADIINRYTVK